MKKITFIPLVVFLTFILSVFGPKNTANAQLFEVEDKVVNVGLGLGNALSFSGSTSGIPPISVSGEYGINDEIGPGVIGVGPYLGFATSKWETSWFGGSYGWKYTYVVVGARGLYHMEFVDDFDTYAGVLLGYNIVTAKEIGETPIGVSASSGGAVFDGFVGGRYYFQDNLSAFAELGFGIAYLTIGVAVKLD